MPTTDESEDLTPSVQEIGARFTALDVRLYEVDRKLEQLTRPPIERHEEIFRTLHGEIAGILSEAESMAVATRREVDDPATKAEFLASLQATETGMKSLQNTLQRQYQDLLNLLRNRRNRE